MAEDFHSHHWRGFSNLHLPDEDILCVSRQLHPAGSGIVDIGHEITKLALQVSVVQTDEGGGVCIATGSHTIAGSCVTYLAPREWVAGLAAIHM